VRDRLPPELARNQGPPLRVWVDPLPGGAADAGLAPSPARPTPAAYSLNWSAPASARCESLCCSGDGLRAGGGWGAGSAAARVGCGGCGGGAADAQEGEGAGSCAKARGGCRGCGGGEAADPTGGPVEAATPVAGCRAGLVCAATGPIAFVPGDGAPAAGMAEVTTAAGGFRAGASRARALAGAPGARSSLCKAALFARFRALCALRAARGGGEGAAAAALGSAHAGSVPESRDLHSGDEAGVTRSQACPRSASCACAPLRMDWPETYQAAKRGTRHAAAWAALLAPPSPFEGWTHKPPELENFV
jgi:hypothetical protein